MSTATADQTTTPAPKELVPLTPYERKQVNEIAGWKAEAPSLIDEVLDTISHPLVKLVERFVPQQTLKDAIMLAYKGSEVLSHRKDIVARAGVADVSELRSGDLARCDRLADEFARLSSTKAVVQGSAIGAGPVLSMEVSVLYALKTVHTIGFCYGYTPSDARGPEFALRTLLVANAGSLKEKQDAMVKLNAIEDVIVEELAKNIMQNELTMLVDRAVEMAAGLSVPFVGMLAQIVTSAAAAYYTAQVAKRVFQERWLRANGKVTRIAPDPRYARSQLQRAMRFASACVYWSSYYVSLTATLPFALAAILLPRQNAAVRGFVDGGAAASRDLQHLKGRLRETALDVGDSVSQPVLAARLA